MAAQLAIQQEQEGLVQDLLVVGKLRRNPHLRHLREGQFLPHQWPFCQEVLQPLLNGPGAGGNCRKQERLRRALHQEFPGMRRYGKVSAGELAGEVLGVRFDIAPALYKTFVGNLLLNSGYLFVAQFAGKEIHYDRTGIGIQSDLLYLLLGFE